MILGKEEEVERGLVFLEKLGFMWVIFMLFGGTLIQIFLYMQQSSLYCIYFKNQILSLEIEIVEIPSLYKSQDKSCHSAIGYNDRARNVSSCDQILRKNIRNNC